MSGLRLAKLPERNPVKLTISLAPGLHRALGDYAEIYSRTYGEREPVAELIPHMLTAFLAGDRGFAKARESLGEHRDEN